MLDRLPLVLSTTALLVSVLGATPVGEAAYNAVVPKNSVGALQLKNGAVTNAKLRGDAVTSGKVKNGSLRASDFKAGQLPAGPVGPKGDQGEKGDKGGKGDRGDPGLSGYEIVQVNNAVTNATFNFVQATCPAGKKPLGAGYATGGPYGNAVGPFAIQTYPNGNGWLLRVGRATAASWTESLYVVCATVAP